MISKNQILTLAKQFKTNESTIYREYLQVLFLNQFYQQKHSQNVLFKGGTAIHLIYRAPRFSENLDFTVVTTPENLIDLLNKTVIELNELENLELKEKSSLQGERFMLKSNRSDLDFSTFINLDFSFREQIFQPQKSILKTDLPILITSFIHHLSDVEMLAEKIRAISTRTKGRDLYDLWYLLSTGTKLDLSIVKSKLEFYADQPLPPAAIAAALNKFSVKDFVTDLRPFVVHKDKEKLEQIFEIAKTFLINNLILVNSIN